MVIDSNTKYYRLIDKTHLWILACKGRVPQILYIYAYMVKLIFNPYETIKSLELGQLPVGFMDTKIVQMTLL